MQNKNKAKKKKSTCKVLKIYFIVKIDKALNFL